MFTRPLGLFIFGLETFMKTNYFWEGRDMKTEKRKANGTSDSLNCFMKKILVKMEPGTSMSATLKPDGTLTITTNSKVALSIFEKDFLTNEN